MPRIPGLYLVATPIGNLEDITLRALRVLKGVDRIACEDTRQTQKLLNHFEISTSTISYHEHNEQARTVELIALLQQGGRVAVVSDAGTPAFSDPGLELVRAAVAAGVRVIPIPGANAALSALIASGMETDRFLYVGFLAAKPGTRRTELEALAAGMPWSDPGGLRSAASHSGDVGRCGGSVGRPGACRGSPRADQSCMRSFCAARRQKSGSCCRLASAYGARSCC